MTAYNHNLRYRPLVGGIVIVADVVEEFGTLGGVATSNGTDRWLITCHHVLARPGEVMPTGRLVFQPEPGVANVVGRTDSVRASAALDCAAAQVAAGVATGAAILGLCSSPPPRAPVIGQRVLKAGRRSGVTEGVVVDVTGSTIRIEPPPSFPVLYDLSERGDSGALWVEKLTGAPVAMHRGGNASGAEIAFATPISDVLAALGLTLVQ